jgi:hypothetical protein
MKNYLGFIAIVLLSSGCPSVPQPTPRGVTWREIGGSVEHTESGMQFPVSLGEFRRSSVRQYDAAGRDVSAGYDVSSTSVPIAITVYIYPSPAVRSIGSPQSVIAEAKRTLARGEFRRVMNEIKQAHQNARAISDEEVSALASSDSQLGYLGRVTYTASFAGRVQPVDSLAYLFCFVADEWTVKYRITYPAGADARPLIEAFIRDLKWTFQTPNKAPEPTPGPVTGHAVACPAPAPVVAHL